MRPILSVLSITSIVSTLSPPMAAAQLAAPATIQAGAPEAVGTAALLGLAKMSLPEGGKVFVKSSLPVSVTNPTMPGSVFQLEQRGGRTVLVETTYDKVFGDYGQGSLKASGERLYPADAMLVYTGPWVTGTVTVGLKQGTVTGFAAYLLRPLGVPVQRASSRIGTVRSVTLLAGAVPAPRSLAPVKAVTVALVKPKPVGQDCGVKFNTESLGDAKQVRGLVCLLLTRDGQGMTLPDGSTLFVRSGGIEHWKGDTMLERSYGLVARDARGRYWLLEWKGWL